MNIRMSHKNKIISAVVVTVASLGLLSLVSFRTVSWLQTDALQTYQYTEAANAIKTRRSRMVSASPADA